MNLDKAPRIPRKLLTSENLSEEAWHLANVLTSNKWNYRRIRQTHITRMITEVIGEPREVNEINIEPVFNEVTISFEALKRLPEYDNGDFLVPEYTVTSTTAQDIDKDEIPDMAIVGIIEDADSQWHPLNDLFETLPETDASDLSNESRLKLFNSLDEFELQRLQEVSYEIDHKGEIEEHETTFAYTLDEARVHELSLSSSAQRILWHPMRLADGTEGEKRPIAVAVLDDDTLEMEVGNMDISIESFMTNQDIIALAEASRLPKEEHIRRVLAMMSMVSSGLIDYRSGKIR